jgi:hypothetical protein
MLLDARFHEITPGEFGSRGGGQTNKIRDREGSEAQWKRRP